MDYTSTILIIDDDQTARETAQALLENQGYYLAFATSGLEGLNKAASLKPDLILLDVIMQGMTGFDVCRRIRSDLQLSEIPVLMITSLNDRESRLQGIQAGADDFITKPFDGIELRSRIRNLSRLNRYQNILQKRSRFEIAFQQAPDGLVIVDETGTILMVNTTMLHTLGMYEEDAHEDVIGDSIQSIVSYDYRVECMEFVKQIIANGESDTIQHYELELDGQEDQTIIAEASIKHMIWDGTPVAQFSIRNVSKQSKEKNAIEQSRAQLAQAFDSTLLAFVRVLDQRLEEPVGHAYRVSEQTVRLARALGMQGDSLLHIRRGAVLHDIGKMAIPDSILFKPGPLTEHEWTLMRKHPEHAYEWLKSIAYLRPALDIPYCHHEKWDGTGYPRGLKGEEIPLAARIFAVVDVWDSLRSERPFRTAWAEEKVREHIRLLSGSHFDPQIVETFLTTYSPFADGL